MEEPVKPHRKTSAVRKKTDQEKQESFYANSGGGHQTPQAIWDKHLCRANCYLERNTGRVILLSLPKTESTTLFLLRAKVASVI
jgi:hypothetical protein